MVIKFKNLSCLYDFIAMETPIVLNNLPFFSDTTLFTSVKNDLYTILLVAMVTKFNNLRIDNSWQGVFCGIRLSSLAIDCTLTCYISNEWSYFSLSNHILDIINYRVS